ncbi:hypothetical protein [Streptococcus ovis]|uniref:hypothetical protein n=1 Tax=Streptococcus ovis TaxID=82806 RepID=UPI00036104C0|nr:hypothetical protein [Streptococcus ovis]
MTKDITTKLKNNPLESDSVGKARSISIGKEWIEINQLRRHSISDLFLSTLLFIDRKIWLGQLIVFTVSTLLVFKMKMSDGIGSIMQVLTGMLLISVLFFMDELFKSFTYGMWELEETFKYDLRQHTMIKFFVFGIVDMVLIIALALVTSTRLVLPIWNILIYLLVPYNIICILLFSVITMWRNYMHRQLMWLTISLLILLFYVVCNVFHIYQLELFYWWGAGVVTGVVLLYQFYLQLQKNFDREVLKWSYE